MTHRTTPGRVVPLWALASLLGGAGAAVQARANGGLATSLGSPAAAAVWSFGSGWVVLAAGLVLLPSARHGLRQVARAVRATRLQWWEVLGGLFGGFFVAVQAFTVPRTGVALFTIAVVGGQTASALAVDRLGLGPAGRAALTPARVVAALATFAGVAVASFARSGGTATRTGLVVLLLAVVAGAGMSVQQAINGKVNQASGHVVATTFVNFCWGLVALGILTGGLAATGQAPAVHPGRVPWWSLCGGLIGVAYIAIAAAAVRVLGVLVAALMSLTGQVVTAVGIDLATGAAPVSARLVLGVLVTLVAAVAAGRAARRAPRPPARPE